ncbi:cysteine desulfurase family protein [Psychrobacter sp. I-STPA10]|uniref:cysteine desulfurase family protein n=1 Tax=Psychrobacter sp. I-STPA10 TaxID=2585769 RepID=UPI001E52B92A|nr:aminotransferase class V-fold PLP-dependent enzyme [Psychrobacter sp. I-STPA10]
MKNIYLDYNAHTPCDKFVIDAMNELWAQAGNPHSIGHYFGWHKQQMIDEALSTFAEIYDCFEDELLFISGATEANNLAIYSGIKLAKRMKPEGNTLLTSHLEHKSVLKPLQFMAKTLGLHLIYINITTEGVIDLKDLQNNLENNQVLWVSCTMTNGIIGTNQPIYQIAQLCEQYDAKLHVDASQAGYLDIACHDLNVDFLTLSAHKIYGPSGIGLMYSKYFEHSDFFPMIIGGGQQNGLRAGTLPVPLIVGFATAVKRLEDLKESETIELIEKRQQLLDGLSDKLNIEVYGNLDDRHPGNLYLSIDGIDSMQLLNNLQPQLAFSLGSACDGLTREYPLLLKTMGISQAKAESSFRVCVGRMTTSDEIVQAIEQIVSVVEKII